MSQENNILSTEICSKYLDGVGIEQLIKDYRISRDKIKKFLSEKEIPLRKMSDIKKKYQVNSTYFDIIDSEEKAYFLGFIYADGCNSRKGLVLQLHPDDIEILEKLKVAMCSNAPISIGKNSKQHDFARFVIYDSYLSESLYRIGCPPAKTLTLNFPTYLQVPKSLLSHFIRGYFDGDGFIGTGKAKHYNNWFGFSIVSTEKFLQGVQSQFNSLGINSRIRKIKNAKAYRLQISGVNHMMKALEFLYKDATIFLERKKKVYTIISSRLKKLKPVLMLNQELKIIKEFQSISSACKFIRTSNSTLPRWINKNQLFKGYFWKFKIV